MSLDPTTAAIVELAWARTLGLDDSAWTAGSGRLVLVGEGAAVLSFVRLFGRSALVGPAWAIEAAHDYDDDALADETTLLGVSRGGRALGAAALYFTDQLVEVPDLDFGAISDDPAHGGQLESSCPPDDVAEVGLSGMESQFILIDESGTALAGAGFNVRQGIVAQLGVLVEPTVRRRGLGHYVSAVAVDAAMAAGLVPQWRARLSNAGSHAIAARLNLVRSGSQTTVILP